MFALIIPCLLILFILILFYFSFRRKWIYVFILFIGIWCVNYYGKVIALNTTPFLSKSGGRSLIRVMSYNVNGENLNIYKMKCLQHIIEESKPDVVFLTEVSSSNRGFVDSIMQATHQYKSGFQNTTYAGHCFYSRHPLSNIMRLGISSSVFSYCFRSMMSFYNDTIALYGVHMASNNYTNDIASVRPEDIHNAKMFCNYVESIESASNKRVEEAYVIKKNYEKEVSDYPSIIMGDFNDVNGSNPLNILEDAGFKDAWWEAGFGYGATIQHPLPFRIDHILYNDRLELVDITKVDSRGMSDHDALEATFLVKSIERN